jgi:hypothetical protein
VRVATAAGLPPPGARLPRAAVGNASITAWPGPDLTVLAQLGLAQVGPAQSGPAQTRMVAP